MPPLRLAVVSTSRSDFGLLAPLIVAAQNDARFTCTCIVTGAHLAAGTPTAAEQEGLRCLRLPRPADSLSLVHEPALVQALCDHACELALVLGDRSELLAVASGVLCAGAVLAHVSGGERTAGAIDDAVRDALSSLADLHYPAHAEAAARLRRRCGLDTQMTWRVCAAGEPGLDAIRIALADGCLDNALPPLPAAPTRADLCVAVHPVTRPVPGASPDETDAILASVQALAADFPGHFFLSQPNGDAGRERVLAAWRSLSERFPQRCVLLPEAGAMAFRAVVRRCGALIGNSSAGLVEAPHLGTPSVDVGTRQRGRLRGPAVVDCPDPAALPAAVAEALRPERRTLATPARNPYGDGHAVPRILDHLAAHGRRADLRDRP